MKTLGILAACWLSIVTANATTAYAIDSELGELSAGMSVEATNRLDLNSGLSDLMHRVATFLLLSNSATANAFNIYQLDVSNAGVDEFPGLNVLSMENTESTIYVLSRDGEATAPYSLIELFHGAR